jgi:hypothetical protein
MAIRAKELEGKLQGVVTDIEKIMSASPRRISALNITFHWPSENSYTEEERTLLENIAWTCPVKESIHPDIHLNVNFNWK